MATLGLVLHPDRPASDALAEEATAWLEDRGHDVRVVTEDGQLTPDVALVLALGGDGTMLRAVDLVCDDGVPVLGVNVGHLGYLTEVEASGLTDALERFFAGDFVIEERMTLRVTVECQAAAHDAHQLQTGEHVALNEAVLEKTTTGHTVRLAVTINGQFFTTYAADGMIVATPTGSTAYNLSARGPVVSPRHRAVLLTPVAPHMLFDRTLVLDAGEDVRVEVIDDGRPAALSVDGRTIGELHSGDAIACTAGKHSARLVTFGGRDFHQILKAKFGLADR